jgi:hypothetical protein
MRSLERQTVSATDAMSIESDIDGVDHAAVQMEAKWGVGRLRKIVSFDLRAKFDRQAKLFNDAVWSGDVGGTRRHGEAMVRAWAALDAAATEAGEQPLSPDVWETQTPDGEVVAIVRTNAEAAMLTRANRAMQVWTLAEIGNVIGHYGLTIGTAKGVFEGATMTAVTTRERPLVSDADLDDLDSVLDLLGA